MRTASDPVHVAIDYTMRQDRGRLIAALVAAIGDFELAEECLSEAMETALKVWSATGIPASRRGWLLQVARRRAIDRLRRARRFEEKAAQIAVLERADAMADKDDHDIPDHRLRLIFTCCHPALDQKTRVALTLRTLGGLSTDEVARAFLDKTPAMAQRLSRARSKIARAGIPFAIPDGPDLPERIGSVLRVIYLIFNEGYGATQGSVQIRTDLCEEALFLARLMVQLCPGEGEPAGLLALILLSHARRAARQGTDGATDGVKDGVYVPLSEQDRSLWDRAQITEGQSVLEAALAQGRVGPYQIQASVNVLHCEAQTAGATDWAQIAALYRLLARMDPGPVVRLNLAVALSRSDGPDLALACLDELAGDLDQYQPFHAARADVLRRLGQAGAARAAYDRALELTGTDTERRFLEARRLGLEQGL